MYHLGEEPSWFDGTGVSSFHMAKETMGRGPKPSVPPLPPAMSTSGGPSKTKSKTAKTKSQGKAKAKKPKMTVIEKAIDMCMSIAQKNVAEGHRPYAAVIVPTEVQEATYLSQGMHPLIGAKDQVEQDCDPCAHAEILAIRKACKKFRRTVLSGFTMVCMSYPCPMCVAAMDWARLDGFYYCLPVSMNPIRNLDEMYHKVGTKDYRSVHLEPYQEVARYIMEKWLEKLK